MKRSFSATAEDLEGDAAAAAAMVTGSVGEEVVESFRRYYSIFLFYETCCVYIYIYI
jgi:hypothetical protein